jgi:hypothetical protein
MNDVLPDPQNVPIEEEKLPEVSYSAPSLGERGSESLGEGEDESKPNETSSQREDSSLEGGILSQEATP